VRTLSELKLTRRQWWAAFLGVVLLLGLFSAAIKPPPAYIDPDQVRNKDTIIIDDHGTDIMSYYLVLGDSARRVTVAPDVYALARTGDCYDEQTGGVIARSDCYFSDAPDRTTPHPTNPYQLIEPPLSAITATSG